MADVVLSQPEVILDAQADLGEGPSWDSRHQCLDWVDIRQGRLHVFNPADGSDRSVEFGEMLGCSAPRRTGGWVLGLESGFAVAELAFLEGDMNAIHGIFAPEPNLPGNRFNDGKCDRVGRFLAGSMDHSEKHATGSLYSLTRQNVLKTLLQGTSISNGLTWSPDGKAFYYIDTPTRRVVRFDYDLDTGSISNPVSVISVPAEKGWPDGMTSDSDGMLWVALWSGARLTRWDPRSGQLLEEITFPALNVSSCIFGGPEFTDLYVTTARKDMTPEGLARYPHSGDLFRLHTNVRGLPTYEFDG
jgi:sugar lactone lactonase YvrE